MSNCQHCEACPVDAGIPCYCDPGICARSAKPGQEAFRERLRRNAKVRASQSAQPSLPASAESIELIRRMKECKSWVARSDCGCGVNQCLAGKGKGGLVGRPDCFACLRENPPTSPPEALVEPS